MASKAVFVPVKIDLNLCDGCGICYEKFSCPAIGRNADKTAFIVNELCNGNASCVQVCPVGAIFHPDRPLPPQRKAGGGKRDG